MRTLIRTGVKNFKCYKELIKLPTFEERYEYLRLKGVVGKDTFGYDRYLNQFLYNSPKWKSSRNFVIVRDLGLDLGAVGHEINGRILVHHMNPITIEDIESGSEDIFDPELLISTCHNTHLAIHFGDESLLPKNPVVRRPNDTIPWKM